MDQYIGNKFSERFYVMSITLELPHCKVTSYWKLNVKKIVCIVYFRKLPCFRCLAVDGAKRSMTLYRLTKCGALQSFTVQTALVLLCKMLTLCYTCVFMLFFMLWRLTFYISYKGFWSDGWTFSLLWLSLSYIPSSDFATKEESDSAWIEKKESTQLSG